MTKYSGGIIVKKRLYTSILLSSVILTAVVAPTMAAADTFDQQINQKDQEISNLTNQQTDAQKQMEQLENQVATINNQAQKLVTEQGTLTQEAAKLKQDIADLEVRIEKRTATIKNQARDVQVNGQSTSFVDAFLNASSLSDAVVRVQAVNTFVKANNDLINQQKSDKQVVKSKEKETADKIATIENNQAILEQKKASLEQTQASLAVAKANLALQQATKEDEKANLQTQKAAAEAEQARVKAQQEAAKQAEATQKAAIQAVATPATTNATPVAGNPTNSTETNPTTPAAQPVTPTPAPAPAPTPTPAPAQPTSGSAIIDEARKHLGKAYVWGAKGPNSFDCSGFTAYVYRHAVGKEIGTWTGAQQNAGTVIPVSQAQPGDLLFWSNGGATTYHVAISLGGNRMIHAANPQQGVREDVTTYFMPSFALRVR